MRAGDDVDCDDLFICDGESDHGYEPVAGRNYQTRSAVYGCWQRQWCERSAAGEHVAGDGLDTTDWVERAAAGAADIDPEHDIGMQYRDQRGEVPIP